MLVTFMVRKQDTWFVPGASAMPGGNPATVRTVIEAINGLSLPASPATIALNPDTRAAFVYVTPSGNSLRGFSY